MREFGPGVRLVDCIIYSTVYFDTWHTSQGGGAMVQGVEASVPDARSTAPR